MNTNQTNELESPLIRYQNLEMAQDELSRNTVKNKGSPKRANTVGSKKEVVQDLIDNLKIAELKKFGETSSLGKFSEYLEIVGSLDANIGGVEEDEEKRRKRKENFYKSVGDVGKSEFYRQKEAVLQEGSEVNCVAYCYERSLSVCGTKNSLSLWNTSRMTKLSHLKFEPTVLVIYPLANNNNLKVFAGTQNGNIQVILVDPTNEKKLMEKEREFIGHSGQVKAMTMLSDERTLVSGASDGRIILWDVVENKEMSPPYEAHAGGVIALSAGGTSEETLLVSGGEDRKVKVWNLQDNLSLLWETSNEGKITSVAISSCGKFLAFGTEKNNLYVFKQEEAKKKSYVQVHLTTETSPILSMCFLPKLEGCSVSSTLMFAVSNRLGRLDATTKEIISFSGHKEAIKCLTLSSGITQSDYSTQVKILTGSKDMTMRIWSVADSSTEKSVLCNDAQLEIVKQIKVNSNYVIACTLNHDRSRIHIEEENLKIQREKNVWIWNLNKNTEEARMKIGLRDLSALDINERGFVVGASDGEIFFVNYNPKIKDHKTSFKVKAHQQQPIVALRFLNQSSHLVSLSTDEFAVWNVEESSFTSYIPRKKVFDKVIIKRYKDEVTTCLDIFEETILIGTSIGRLILLSLKPKDQEDKPPVVWKAHERKITDAKFALREGKIISSATDNKLKIWDSNSTSPINEINCGKLHGSNTAFHVTAFELTSDNARIVVSCSDRMIRIFEIETGKQVGVSEEIDEVSHLIALSPDQSKIFISISVEKEERPNSILTIDLGLLKTMKVLIEGSHLEPVLCLAMSSDGRFLASGSVDRSIKIWNVAENKHEKDLSGHAQEVTALKFVDIFDQNENKEKTILLSGGADNTIRIWEEIAGNWTAASKAFKRVTAKIVDIGIYEDDETGGLFVCIALSDRTLRLWNLDPEAFDELRSPFLPTSSPINCLVVTSNGQKAFCGTNDKIKVYDLPEEQELDDLPDQDAPVLALVLHEKSNKLFSGSEEYIDYKDKTEYVIKIWGIEDGVLLATLLDGHDKEILSLVIDDEGNTLFSASKDNTICLWDIPNNKKLSVFSGHKKPVNALVLTPDQTTLYSAGEDTRIRSWNLEDSSRFPFLEGHSKEITAIVVTPAHSERKNVITASADKNIIIWDINDARQISLWKGHSEEITGMALSWPVNQPKKLISFSKHSKEAWVWSLDDLQNVYLESFINLNSAIDSLVFVKDERFAIASCSDSYVRIVDISNNHVIGELVEHFGNVPFVLLNDDMKLLFSGGNDSKILVWDVQEFSNYALTPENPQTQLHLPMQPILTLCSKFCNEGPVMTMLLGEREESIYAGYQNGMIKEWDLSSVSSEKEKEKNFVRNSTMKAVRFMVHSKHRLIVFSEGCIDIINKKDLKIIQKFEIANDNLALFSIKEEESKEGIVETLEVLVAKKNEMHTQQLTLSDHDKFTLSPAQYAPIMGIPDEITAECLSPKQDMLVLASKDFSLYVWDLYKSKKLNHFKGHGEKITALLMSEDNDRIFSASVDKSIGVWSIKKDANITFITGSSGAVLSLVFGPDESFLLAGSGDGNIYKCTKEGNEFKKINTIENEKIQALAVLGEEVQPKSRGKKKKNLKKSGNNAEKSIIYLVGGSSQTLYKLSDDEESEKEKLLVLNSPIMRLVLSPNKEHLLIFVKSSKMVLTETLQYMIIREIELSKDNFRTVPVFPQTENNIRDRKNPVMLYFNKLINLISGEQIFEFETFEDIQSFFFDTKSNTYYYISKEFKLFHFKMSFFTDYLRNFLNDDSLVTITDAEKLCQKKQSVFPFFFSFLHLIAITGKEDYFTKAKLEEVYNGAVSIEYFYNLDIFRSTPLDILLFNQNSTLVNKYLGLLFDEGYFSKGTFAQKSRFSTYEFRPNYCSLDLILDLLKMSEEDLSVVGKFLDNSFMDLDKTVYNNTLEYPELDDPEMIESNNCQTNDEAFLRAELDRLLDNNDEKPKTEGDEKSKKEENEKKKAIVKAKIICIPNIGNILDDKTQDIFSRISDCDHKNEIFGNNTIKILAEHIWKTQIKRYYMIELTVFMIFFVLFNINMFYVYQQRLQIETDPDLAPFATVSMVLDILVFLYGIFVGVNEIRELKNADFTKYKKSVWNYFDALLIVLIPLSCALDFYLAFNPTSEYVSPFKVIFSLTMFCFWMRFISFFRAVAETAKMIRLIFTIISAVKYFVLFMILFMLTLTATFFVMEVDNLKSLPNVWNTFLVFYGSTVGNADAITEHTIVYDNLTTFYSIISTFLFPIMLLNLLVAIIGDMHGEIKDAEENTRLYELINILVDSNTSLVTAIVKLFYEPEVKKYAIYIYNDKHVEKEDDQMKKLGEEINNKLEETKTELHNYVNQMINDESTRPHRNITKKLRKMQKGIQSIGRSISKFTKTGVSSVFKSSLMSQSQIISPKRIK